ncbi:MAG: hypothetical protein ACYSU7_00290 [Planctomycetota bacterium]|jgi:hypothetical protein
MSLPIDREILTQAAIALGACIGSWMFFVQPKVVELRELDASIQKLRVQAAALSHLSIEEIARDAPKLKERSTEIGLKGAFARDSSQLYGRIMSLAKEHDVQVKNLRPGDQKAGRDKTMTVTRIDMTAEGDYENIANFFDALNGVGAYLRTTSVQIAPTKRAGGSSTVVQLGFEVLEFQLPKVVQELTRRAGS